MTEVLDVLDVITGKIEGVLASVQAMGVVLASLADRAQSAGDPLTRDDLAGMRAHAADVLAAHDGLVAGAGVVLAPGLLANEPRWIDWWWATGRKESAPERLRVDLDPKSAEFSDYTSMEWYREPERTGRWTITGPYVDYICTREYTFTLAVPVLGAGRFAGVAGADILAAQVEQLVLPDLARLAGDVVLISANGRVIASNNVRVLTGAISPPGQVIAAAGTLPWSVRRIGAS